MPEGAGQREYPQAQYGRYFQPGTYLPAGMHAETGQGLYGLRTASLDEGSPRGSESKNGAGNDEKEVERIKNIMEWNNRTPMS